MVIDQADWRPARCAHRRAQLAQDDRGAMMATTAQLVTGSVYVPERNYAEFETGNVTLSIVDGEAMGIGHHVHRIALALRVDDVAEARSTLESRGVQFQGDILDTGVCHMAFFADPDGNALMLHHRYAPRVTDS
jgi:predicted enzyme related to lactoylglutathione lyase